MKHHPPQIDYDDDSGEWQPVSKAFEWLLVSICVVLTVLMICLFFKMV